MAGPVPRARKAARRADLAGRAAASPPLPAQEPPFCFRSLVDTVYALKDEVQELRQVRRPPLFLAV